MTIVTTLGFSDPVFQAQHIFRSVMDAIASPGSIIRFTPGVIPPPPLSPELAAIALALADNEAPLWLDPYLRAMPTVIDYLRFHTGAPITENPKEACFALISDPSTCWSIDDFAMGTAEYPDTSTTLVFAVDKLSNNSGLHLSGPGIKDERLLSLRPFPDELINQLKDNQVLFPCGVDCLFVASGQIAAIPRSTSINSEV